MSTYEEYVNEENRHEGRVHKAFHDRWPTMAWTKEVPKVDGYYWERWDNGREVGLTLLRVKRGVIAMYEDDAWMACRGSLYYGPIEVPQPPEVE